MNENASGNATPSVHDNASDRGWHVWVDTGGTFTDCVAIDPAGRLRRAKVLSSSSMRGRVGSQDDSRTLTVVTRWDVPHDFFRGFAFRCLDKSGTETTVRSYDSDRSRLTLEAELRAPLAENAPFEVRSPEEAPVLAARLVTGTPPGRPLPPMAMRLGTTRGTNALLERKGVPPVLFITRGFRDLLEIGTQQRPELFALEIKKPRPLYCRVIEVRERLAADGSVLEELDLSEVEGQIEGLPPEERRSAALALMHSYRNPAHEKRLERLLLEKGLPFISVSSDLAPFIRLLPRAQTTVVNAYLAPVIDTYLRSVSQQSGTASLGSLHIMTSAGGLVGADSYRPKDSLLSGPVGGVVGAALAGERCGRRKVIAFDMGGTSTDVSRYDGDFEYVFEHRVGDADLVAPALLIESVAAGGGSICWFDGHRLGVGPESAGAHPGPACYGAGGPLTVTDVNLLLGRLDPEGFEIPIDIGAARDRLDEILNHLQKATGENPRREVLLQGFLDIANERMADAIRSVSVRRGYDASEYTLVAFGGAGGQHACAIARLLDMDSVIIPKNTSLLSALGMGHARIERFSERQVLKPLRDVEPEIGALIESLRERAKDSVRKEGIAEERVEVRRVLVNMRYTGQDTSLSIDYEEGRALSELFVSRHAELYGYRPEEREIEVESLRVVASSKPGLLPPDGLSRVAPRNETARTVEAWFDGELTPVPCIERDSLHPGSSPVQGPCLIAETHSATVVEADWSVTVHASGALLIQAGAQRLAG